MHLNTLEKYFKMHLLVQAASVDANLAIVFIDFFLPFYVFCFSPTSGKLPWLKFYFPIVRSRSLDQPLVLALVFEYMKML